MNPTNLHHRAETLLDIYGAYHLARVQGDPALADLGTPFARAQDLLARQAEEYRRAEIAVMEAMGRLDALRDLANALEQREAQPPEEMRSAVAQCEIAQRRAAEAFARLEEEKRRWFQAYSESYRQVQLRRYRKRRGSGTLRIDPEMLEAGSFRPLAT